MSSRELVEPLMLTAEVCGTDLSEGAATMIAGELAEYDRNQVMSALRKCRLELKGRLTMAAIIERLDDGRPGAEEAWAMIPYNEATSAVWTTEMAQAFGVALRLVDAGDMVGARMAFKETYLRMVSQARDKGDPVEWTVTLGHDPGGRDVVLMDAVEKGRLTLREARQYSPTLLLSQSQGEVKSIADVVKQIGRAS